MAYGSYSFDLINPDTLENLAKGKTMLPYKKVDGKKDERWNTKLITSKLMQSMINGDSIPKISKSFSSVMDMNKVSARRNARTSITSCENQGRMYAMLEAEKRGVKMKKQWMATHDGRTRDSHLNIDGETVELNEAFTNGLMEPGDPDGEPEEVYNCRCTMIAVVDGIDEKAFNRNAYTPQKVHVAQGRDISDTWTRRADKFDFEIEDVINAQGFDGKPRIVSQEEFDEAVKAANGGNGFIAQRTYSAPDQETLDAYREQLYNGNWYVDCSTGGAQYGQGMYCAADYTGTLTEGIKEEMRHYQELGVARNPESAEAAYNNYIQNAINNANSDLERAALKEKLLGQTTDAEWDLYSTRSREEDRAFTKLARRIEEEAKEARDTGISYIETFTLDPSAKVIAYNDLRKQQRDEGASMAIKLVGNLSGLDKYEQAYMAKQFYNADLMPFSESLEWYGKQTAEYIDELDQKIVKLRQEIDDKVKDFEKMDCGSYAAMKGYDAINAEGHGESGSYTVILNRTKVIFRGE